MKAVILIAFVQQLRRCRSTAKMFCLVLISVLASAGAAFAAPPIEAEFFAHGIAGFSVASPTGWKVRMLDDGFEFGKGSARIQVAKLGIAEGKAEDILTLIVAAGREKPPVATGNTVRLDTPYPGLRTTQQAARYVSEVAVLDTPYGFYLISLEQEDSQPDNLKAFESVLAGFKILATPPFIPNLNLRQAANVGPVELMFPAGNLSLKPDFALWKSPANGILIAELVKRGKGKGAGKEKPLALADLLQDGEGELPGGKNGPSIRTSQRTLHIGDRETISADYEGEVLRAKVVLSAINDSLALRLTLIARRQAFASHLPALDAASLSVMPALGVRTSPQATPRETRQPSKAAPTPESGQKESNWQAELRSELRRCAARSFLAKVMCDEKARWKYCEGRWNSIPECEVSGN